VNSARTLSLILFATIIDTSAARAGPIEDQWAAETSQTRDGRTIRTIATFTYDGRVQNGRALWLVDVRCETRAPGAVEVSAVTGSGTAMLAQGGWGGSASPIGDVYVVEAENDLHGGKGKLEVDNPACASGIPTIKQRPRGAAAPTLPKVEPTGRPWVHNGSMVMINPEAGVVVYLEPKASLRPAVNVGSVLFRGTLKPGGDVHGTAYAFKEGCPPAPYPVRGRYSDRDYTLTLRGAGPIRKGCEVVGYSERSPHAVLAFSYLLDD
jgi:hypothetical protein